MHLCVKHCSSNRSQCMKLCCGRVYSDKIMTMNDCIIRHSPHHLVVVHLLHGKYARQRLMCPFHCSLCILFEVRGMRKGAKERWREREKGMESEVERKQCFMPQWQHEQNLLWLVLCTVGWFASACKIVEWWKMLLSSDGPISLTSQYNRIFFHFRCFSAIRAATEAEAGRREKREKTKRCERTYNLQN